MKINKQTLIGLSMILPSIANAAEPIEALENALKKNAETHQARLIKVSQSDPKLQKATQELADQLRIIQRSGKDIKARAKMAQAELAKNGTLLDQVYKKAQFDENSYHAEQGKLVAFFNQKNKQKVQYKKKGKLSYQLIESPDFEAPTEGAEIELTKPYAFREIDSNGDGRLEANTETGEFFTVADGGNFANFSNKVGLGHFFEIPANTNRIRISADVPEVSSAFVGLANLGGGMGKTKLKIVIEGEDRVLCSKTKTLDTAYVYFLDLISVDNETNMTFACEFNAPPAGQRIVIRFLSTALVDTGLANMFSLTKPAPSNVRIRLNPLQ